MRCAPLGNQVTVLRVEPGGGPQGIRRGEVMCRKLGCLLGDMQRRDQEELSLCNKAKCEWRDPNHPSVPYHYYEPFGPDECTMYLSHERGRKGSHHRFITEKRVFKNWARTFNIHFFQPDWKPDSLAINHPENKPVF